jgi:hypothetical protein
LMLISDKKIFIGETRSQKKVIGLGKDFGF